MILKEYAGYLDIEDEPEVNKTKKSKKDDNDSPKKDSQKNKKDVSNR